MTKHGYKRPPRVSPSQPVRLPIDRSAALPRFISTTSRRKLLRLGLTFAALPIAAVLNLGGGSDPSGVVPDADAYAGDLTELQENSYEGSDMQIHYLEIVTQDVEQAVALYAKIHGVSLGKPDENLGGARTAELASGARLGIRAPLHDAEKSVVRPYLLVDDINVAVANAEQSGALIAVPPMEIKGQGTCAIVMHGGIESGLWQL